jgi:hypothetical protein
MPHIVIDNINECKERSPERIMKNLDKCQNVAFAYFSFPFILETFCDIQSI